jgi:hypothetical protein
MITIYYQRVEFEGREYDIRFSDTSLNDTEEMPGMELLDVDGMESYSVPARIWEFCQSQMDTKVALTAEEMFRW